MTSTHPFAVGQDEWKVTGELEVGDIVLGLGFVGITSIEEVMEPIEVYNMTVDGTHNFYVWGKKKHLYTTRDLVAIFNTFLSPQQTGRGLRLFLVHNKGTAPLSLSSPSC